MIAQQESTSLTKQANLSKRRRRSQTNVPVLGSSNVNNKVPATSVTRSPVFISRLPYYEKSRFGVLRKVQLAQFRQPSWRMRTPNNAKLPNESAPNYRKDSTKVTNVDESQECYKVLVTFTDLILCNNYFVLHKIVHFLCNRLCELKKN